MLRSTRTRPTEASFDLTPMIDVVMLLIVFFTLTSQFRDAIPTTVDLPREVGQEAAEAAPASISLELRRDGTLASNGREVGLDEIITHEFPLEQFEKAFETMISGEGIKVVMNVNG